MPRYFYDADGDGLYSSSEVREEVAREDAQVLALIQLNKTMREIAGALRWLGKSDGEKDRFRQAVEIMDQSPLGKQVAADSAALKSRT